MSKRNKGALQHTRQMNMKCTETEYSDLQKVNQELFGGDLNKSDLLRFLVKVAVKAVHKAQVEVKTTRVLKVGGEVVEL